jgi:hypothetical protein
LSQPSNAIGSAGERDEQFAGHEGRLFFLLLVELSLVVSPRITSSKGCSSRWWPSSCAMFDRRRTRACDWYSMMIRAWRRGPGRPTTLLRRGR